MTLHQTQGIGAPSKTEQKDKKFYAAKKSKTIGKIGMVTKCMEIFWLNLQKVAIRLIQGQGCRVHGGRFALSSQRLNSFIT